MGTAKEACNKPETTRVAKRMNGTIGIDTGRGQAILYHLRD